MTNNDYQVAAAAYADELRSFLGIEPTISRSAEPGRPTPDTLARRADRLAERSADLFDQTVPFLSDEDPSVQLGAEQSLLAQAVASLHVAQELMATEVDEETADPRAAAMPAGLLIDYDELLALIETPPDEAAGGMAVAQAAPPGELREASPVELIQSANEAIDQVLNGVGAFSQDAVTGLLGLDTALLRQAAQLISGDLAELVARLGEQTSLLVTKAVRFLLQAYDSLLAALGQDMASALRQQASVWIEQLQQGNAIGQLLGAVLQADVVRTRVAEVVAASQAPAEALGHATASVQALPENFQARTKLAGQILAGIAVLKRIPAARLPMIELASAAVYISLLGYVVFTGGDYVDAPRLERIGRVAGVLQVVETGLA